MFKNTENKTLETIILIENKVVTGEKPVPSENQHSHQPDTAAKEDTVGDTGQHDQQEKLSSDSDRQEPDTDVNPFEHSDRSNEESRFLIGVDYDDRAERRRVEYRLENWDGAVDKVPPLTRIVEGESFYELYDELQDTVDDPDHLSVYELNDLMPSKEERTVRINRVYEVEMDKLEWAVDSLLNKRTVTQVDETTFELRPDASGATVTLEFELMDVQRGARMELTLTGPTPAPNAVKDAIIRDLGYLLPAPEEVFDS